MEPYIQISRYPYEEPYDVNLVVAASNGRLCGELEIYSDADDFARLAKELRGFPNRQEDEVLWELGSEDPERRCEFYFRLRVKQVVSNGRCAVEVRLNNNATPPDREVVEFSMPAMPADLGRLAQLLEEFGKLQHIVLVWKVTDGELRTDA